MHSRFTLNTPLKATILKIKLFPNKLKDNLNCFLQTEKLKWKTYFNLSQKHTQYNFSFPSKFANVKIWHWILSDIDIIMLEEWTQNNNRKQISFKWKFITRRSFFSVVRFFRFPYYLNYCLWTFLSVCSTFPIIYVSFFLDILTNNLIGKIRMNGKFAFGFLRSCDRFFLTHPGCRATLNWNCEDYFVSLGQILSLVNRIFNIQPYIMHCGLIFEDIFQSCSKITLFVHSP